VRAIDTDIVIMPNRYLEEIRLLPESKTSGTVASGDVSFPAEGLDVTIKTDMIPWLKDAVGEIHGIRANARERPARESYPQPPDAKLANLSHKG
jgi:hypothetical protein